MKLNTAEVAQLQPDYLGFIFWERSSRYFEGEIPALPDHIKKVGVFVDSDIDSILEKIKRYGLQGVQLHGQESPEFCAELLSAVKVIDRGV
ncbi:MAG: phosphoribosylanthranilate isomerase, partial [Maribacter sp.]